MLFGKIVYGQAQATQRIFELLSSVLDELELRPRVIEVGMRAECGIGGNRLSAPQRQKLALARALMKRPDILVLHDATMPLDSFEQPLLRDALLEACEGQTLIWALQSEEWADRFDHVLSMSESRVTFRSPGGSGGRDGEERPLEQVAQGG